MKSKTASLPQKNTRDYEDSPVPQRDLLSARFLRQNNLIKIIDFKSSDQQDLAFFTKGRRNACGTT